MDLKNINMSALIEQILKKNHKLTRDLLIKITDSSTTTYDLVGLLCDYINAFKTVEKGEDLKALCDISVKFEEIKNKAKLLGDKYNQAMTELLDVKSQEINLKGKNTDLEVKIKNLEAKIRDLESQIALFDIIKG